MIDFGRIALMGLGAVFGLFLAFGGVYCVLMFLAVREDGRLCLLASAFCGFLFLRAILLSQYGEDNEKR